MSEQPADEAAALAGVSTAVRYVWLAGITLSAACLIIQMVLLALLPKARQLDQKILCQLSVARFVNTLTEYLLSDLQFTESTKFVLFALYCQSDAVLICWMFVFTKNLYDKVVQVFVLQRQSFLLLSVLIWLLAVPPGVLCPTFLEAWPEYFDVFYKTYAVVKFIVLFINLLFFCNIFYVIFDRNRNINRNLRDVIKTCVIAFILVNVTSLQVLLTDLCSFFTASSVVSRAFCLINSFQVVAVTFIFVILVKNASQ